MGGCSELAPCIPNQLCSALDPLPLLQKYCTTDQANFGNIISEAPWLRVPYPGQVSYCVWECLPPRQKQDFG